MLQVLDFLSERARGFILTMTGAGIGLSPEIIQTSAAITNTLLPLQRTVLVLSAAVAILTIISYGYKFYKFCKSNFKKK